eukprot:CAMPEP_0201483054 /NCGR_PEP_ID=MMETSP0151_2-20130828/7286_1 /ASSEMBLY_ACC=CAM_ASM_000257 /TAXON_ID=200890 /ORGANISM="Paramoeba atlantica, Strain 621/1 / CCAP 1560/9" /LENGTH=186 /DNA_ID=CAMNT_0047866015 /DNA_START=98 /DNA_END=658 /DNA_ORIENTATION=-
MKATSVCGTKTFSIDVRLTFGEKPDQDSGLVSVEGEMEHTYDQENSQYMDSTRRDMAEIEVVRGNYNPKTRELILIGIQRTGIFPKEEHRPAIVEEDCDECDCIAFLTTTMIDFGNQECFCGHTIESHKNRPQVKHLIIPAQYNLTLPESDLSEKFEAGAQNQRDPNHTAKLLFWEGGVFLKPAIY